MKIVILLSTGLIAASARADYRSASEAVDAANRAQAEQDFARRVPQMNAWIDRTLTTYSKKLGGALGPIAYRSKSGDLYSSAEWKTNRGYECAMMVGIVLLSGRFNMIVQCASVPEGQKTYQVFSHGTGGWP